MSEHVILLSYNPQISATLCVTKTVVFNEYSATLIFFPVFEWAKSGHKLKKSWNEREREERNSSLYNRVKCRLNCEKCMRQL